MTKKKPPKSVKARNTIAKSFASARTWASAHQIASGIDYVDMWVRGMLIQRNENHADFVKGLDLRVAARDHEFFRRLADHLEANEKGTPLPEPPIADMVRFRILCQFPPPNLLRPFKERKDEPKWPKEIDCSVTDFCAKIGLTVSEANIKKVRRILKEMKVSPSPASEPDT